ncbi:MAG: hypothetical protein JO007_07220 [Alphaproteobacteria bacterium]|nr:hypothetical protein [Alphaproteobacteria bacterium]
MADELGIAVKLLGIDKIDRFSSAFAAIELEMPDGLVMAADTLGNLNRSQMYSFASKYRLPTIYESATSARQGGLMSYGPDAMASESLRDPPRPSPFRLVLNLNTAQLINLTLPSDLIAQADEVIASSFR